MAVYTAFEVLLLRVPCASSRGTWIMVLPLNGLPTPVDQKSCWQLDWTNINRGRNAESVDLMLSKLETLDGCVPCMQES